jgi:hypothetical protein
MKEKLSSLISKTICFKFSDHLKIYQMLRCLSHCWKSLILNLKQMQVCNTDFSNGQDHWKLFIFPNYCFQLQYRLSSSNPNNEPSMYTPTYPNPYYHVLKWTAGPRPCDYALGKFHDEPFFLGQFSWVSWTWNQEHWNFCFYVAFILSVFLIRTREILANLY